MGRRYRRFTPYYDFSAKVGVNRPGGSSPAGSHVSPATIWEWVHLVAQLAGIPYLTTHQLRHTALATANDNLGDLRAVQTFARHVHTSQTAGYTRTTARRLQDVVEALKY